MSYTKLQIKTRQKYEPKLVLWDPNFTSADPFFRVAVHPEATIEGMAKDFFGYQFTDSEKGLDYLQFPDPDSGYMLCIGTWKKFLEKATDEQIREVKQTLNLL